ncbi:MAG: hypothetical protein AAF412_15110, partial [Pseudomonadota bacterium]
MKGVSKVDLSAALYYIDDIQQLENVATGMKNADNLMVVIRQIGDPSEINRLLKIMSQIDAPKRDSMVDFLKLESWKDVFVASSFIESVLTWFPGQLTAFVQHWLKWNPAEPHQILSRIYNQRATTALLEFFEAGYSTTGLKEMLTKSNWEMWEITSAMGTKLFDNVEQLQKIAAYAKNHDEVMAVMQHQQSVEASQLLKWLEGKKFPNGLSEVKDRILEFLAVRQMQLRHESPAEAQPTDKEGASAAAPVEATEEAPVPKSSEKT